MQLSEHFSLDEMVHSDLAMRKGISNTPDEGIISKLKDLSEHILEPVRVHFGIPFLPSSGFRCLELNRLIGSSDNSQHVRGEAVDFKIPGIDNFDVAFWVYKNLSFDQLILECYTLGSPNSGWIHCSFTKEAARGEVKTYTGGKYLDGLIA